VLALLWTAAFTLLALALAMGVPNVKRCIEWSNGEARLLDMSVLPKWSNKGTQGRTRDSSAHMRVVQTMWLPMPNDARSLWPEPVFPALSAQAPLTTTDLCAIQGPRRYGRTTGGVHQGLTSNSTSTLQRLPAASSVWHPHAAARVIKQPIVDQN
jgi:hypothetical protein